MSSKYPELMFPLPQLKICGEGANRRVWCAVRGCYLPLTPEEWVRRHVVEFIREHYGIELQRIIEEYPVKLNGTDQRADVVIVSTEGQPVLMIECKAAVVAISADTLAQATRYNHIIGARYVMLTNGLRLYCYELTADGHLQQLKALPTQL